MVGSTVASARLDRWADLSRLKVLSLVLPLSFLLLVETVRFVVVEDDLTGDLKELSGHALLALVTVIGVVGFSLTVFVLIDRAQRRMVRQNRELATATAVSAAVRGARTPTDIADAAVDALLSATGAEEVEVVLVPRHRAERLTQEAARRGRRADGERLEPWAGTGYDPRDVVVPLTSGARTEGEVRLRLPAGTEPLGFDTLQAIGQQLGAAVQTARHIEALADGHERSHAFFQVLLQVSSEAPLPEVLRTLVRHTRELAHGEHAVLVLNEATTRHLVSDADIDPLTLLPDGGLCVCTVAETSPSAHFGCGRLPVASPAETGRGLAATVRGPWGSFGELWVTASDDTPFDDSDRRFLDAMAEMASIAVTHARMRQRDEHAAVVGERDRIAREMHDGMAQVLAVTHLRLRALEASPDLRGTPAADEAGALAALCHEAYADVRETILGLRESPRVDRTMLESLQAFLDAWTRQSGVPARLVRETSVEPVLPDRCQAQVMRVVQEALTNVRKHAGATLVTVRVQDADSGVSFVIEDDGTGFDTDGPDRRVDSFGLRTMTERMALVHGGLRVESAPGRGTRIVATVPLPSVVRPSEAGRGRG